MRNEQLDLAFEKCFKDELSEKAKELEECKDVAFEIWNTICEIYKKYSPKTMKLYVSGLKIILKYDFENEEISHTFPYSHPKIIKFVSLIASYSDIKGKIFSQSDGLRFKFSYK